jgi:murein DD-endopeptidase MepM/ murein hydrolase activator NlpD
VDPQGVEYTPSPTGTPDTDVPTGGILNPPGRVSSLTAPVDGKITRAYAMDTLIFSPTLKEWSVHRGVDFEAADKAPVLAALDGVVKEVNRTP